MKLISLLIISIIFEICGALNFLIYNVIINYLIHFLFKSEKIFVLSMLYLHLKCDLISHIFIVITNLNSNGVRIFKFDVFSIVYSCIIYKLR